MLILFVQMEHDQNTNPLSEVLTEKELLDLFGLKRPFLDRLRLNHQFPFCKVSPYVRFYLVKDVRDYIKSKRVVLNRD